MNKTEVTSKSSLTNQEVSFAYGGTSDIAAQSAKNGKIYFVFEKVAGSSDSDAKYEPVIYVNGDRFSGATIYSVEEVKAALDKQEKSFSTYQQQQSIKNNAIDAGIDANKKAIDAKIAKSSIEQTLGTGTTTVPSSKAVKDAIAAAGQTATDSLNTVKSDVNDLKAKSGYKITYDKSGKTIKLTDGKQAVLATIDTTDFIKDGMVDSVKVEKGKLVISFNTDAGKEPISIDITDIFKATDYYKKGEVDSKVTAAKNELDGKIAKKQDKLVAGDNITIAPDTNKISAMKQTDENFTTALKTQLTNLQSNLGGVKVDTSLSPSSTNPVQNKAVNAAINSTNSNVTAVDNRVKKLEGAGYTKVEKSSTNGNIKIAGSETQVFRLLWHDGGSN